MSGNSKQSVKPEWYIGIGALAVTISLLIMALTPAICEEALFRGLILHTLKDVKNPTVLMLIVAFLFGAFHLDLSRWQR
jgi:membrane protease YdiL (CAAX protease family)